VKINSAAQKLWLLGGYGAGTYDYTTAVYRGYRIRLKLKQKDKEQFPCLFFYASFDCPLPATQLLESAAGMGNDDLSYIIKTAREWEKKINSCLQKTK
jgi:hypothetical protein